MTDEVESDEVEQSNEAPEGYVPIPDAADEDLEAFLARGDSEPDSEPDAPPATGETQGEAPPPEPAPAPETEPVSEDEYQRLQAQVERQRAQIEQQEHFIQNRNNQLGEARRQLREMVHALKSGFDERAVEDPAQAMKDLREIEKHEDQIRAIDQEEARNIQSHEGMKLVLRHVPEDDIDLDAMSTILAEDGIAPSEIEAFRRDPVMYLTPVVFIQAAKRAKAEKYLWHLTNYTRELQQKYKALKGKPQELLNGVQRELRRGPQVNAANGNSARRDKSPNVKPANMTDKQIEEFLAHAK